MRAALWLWGYTLGCMLLSTAGPLLARQAIPGIETHWLAVIWIVSYLGINAFSIASAIGQSRPG